MAIRPMPTPSAEPYATYSTEKNKKKKQTNSTYVTNTVTQPPQPAPVVPSALPVTNNTQTLPKQNTASQTKSNLSNTASYNPLSLKQNNTGSQSAMDTIYNKTVTYDAVPTPQIQHGSYKSPVQKSYSYTETKPGTNQYVNNAVNTYAAPKQQMYTSPKTYPSAPPKPYPLDPPKTDIGEYKTFGGYKNANPYVSKDRVDDPWIESKAGTTKPNWNKLLEINENTDHWGYPKTIKDGAEPKFIPARTPEVNYGINREMAQSVALKPDPVKELYVEYLKRMVENNKGINREIAQTNFLDHRDQNPVEKFIERNPFNTTQETQYVTKDNVYEQTPEKIKTELTNTGTVVNSEISSLKRQREDLLFEVQYCRRNSDDPELEKLNYDIEYLQHIQKKIELGLKYQYHFANDELNSLSQADIDDIMNSKEEYSQNLPYLSPYAQAIRSANKGYKTYQNSVGVVENIGVKYNLREELFTIFDKNNPQNNFKFKIESEFNPKGYYESKIVVKDSDNILDEKIYYDLAESLDGMVVPDKAKQQLEYFAEANKRPKLEYDGFGLADAVSYGLDFIDLMIIIGSDYQEDKELGIDSARETFGTIGSWLGNIAGTAAGAKAGVALGITFGTPGMVVGSILGAAFGAYLLSSALEDLGRYLGEKINESEYPIERYYERGK